MTYHDPRRAHLIYAPVIWIHFIYLYLGKKIVRAMYDYQSDGGGADDLNFQKGDIMEITSE